MFYKLLEILDGKISFVTVSATKESANKKNKIVNISAEE
jgi:hypothetical protein